MRDTFRPRIEGARTRAEFNRLMNLMLGELNASHLGHSGRTGPPQEGDGASTGRLGLRFDRFAYENEGRFVVAEVLEGVRLGQRALLAPMVLVTNQHTLSDGEDFTEG